MMEEATVPRRRFLPAPAAIKWQMGGMEERNSEDGKAGRREEETTKRTKDTKEPAPSLTSVLAEHQGINS